MFGDQYQMFSFFKNYILESTVFLCGALVMIYEIIGSRVLAPHIGTSTYIWTSLIGVILGALSLGYWLGGKWADKQPDLKILSGAIFLAGGMVSVTILIKGLILTIVSELELGLELKSLVAALILFAPASVFLGFVTPYAVKLKTKNLDETGKTVGRLYALSTIGSILGTFSAGFLLIPFVGTNRTLYLIAGMLFLISILIFPFSASRIKIGLILVFAIGVGSNELLSYYLKTFFNFYDIDTEYSRVQVFDMVEKKSGLKKRVMKIDPKYFQSAMYLEKKGLASEYLKYYHLVEELNPGFKKTLMIGGAGFSFPKDYLRTYPKAEIDVVEIDPGMTEIAKKHFRLRENGRLKIFHEDGRVFLNRAKENSYDAIFIDAFSTLFSIPYQLTTIESAREIKRVLKKNGIIIFNIGGAVEGPGGKFFLAELKTYQKIFPTTLVLQVDPKKKKNEVQNLILIATNQSPPPAIDNKAGGYSLNFKQLFSIEIDRNIPVLTDDFVPVEYYNSISIN
jgi:spermidine synthase